MKKYREYKMFSQAFLFDYNMTSCNNTKTIELIVDYTYGFRIYRFRSSLA